MTSCTDSSEPKAPTDSRAAYLQTALPTLALYVFFVWRTPGWMLQAHDPAFSLMRIAILVMWLAVMYLFRLKRSIPWKGNHFVIGFLLGFPWVSGLGALSLIAYLWVPRYWDSPPLEGYLAWIASGIFYGSLSGLWSAQTRTPGQAAANGFFFFLLQFVVDALLLSQFTYTA